MRRSCFCGSPYLGSISQTAPFAGTGFARLDEWEEPLSSALAGRLAWEPDLLR